MFRWKNIFFRFRFVKCHFWTKIDENIFDILANFLLFYRIFKPKFSKSCILLEKIKFFQISLNPLAPKYLHLIHLIISTHFLLITPNHPIYFLPPRSGISGNIMDQVDIKVFELRQIFEFNQIFDAIIRVQPRKTYYLALKFFRLFSFRFRFVH